MTAKVKAAKPLIQASTIARVLDKVTGKFLGFLVKSNSSNDYYQVTCTKIADECVWHCNCAARVECCHIKACKEICEARRELKKQTQQGEQVTEEVAPITSLQKRRAYAPLNGNQGFSLLKPAS